jgi:uncharacterized protein (TIGR03437 family)
VTPGGIISTVAGAGTSFTCSPGACSPFYGDGGPATSAGLFDPEGVAVDASGNLFIADTLNYRVRKVSAGGIISTVAGKGVQSSSGDGGQATSASVQPYIVAVDTQGNLFIADYADNFIRKVSVGGIISTVAGNGKSGFSGDGGPATSAGLNPSGVVVDASGNLFIADFGSGRIREVSPAASSLSVAPATLSFSLFAGGSSTQSISVTGPAAGLAWVASTSASWIILSPNSGKAAGPISVAVNTASLQPGAYTASITIVNSVPSPPQEVTVSAGLTVSGDLSVTPAALNFQIAEGAPAQSQSLQIGGAPGDAWQATTTTSTGGAWLSLSQASGQIPASPTVTANAAGLPDGTYRGSITIRVPGGTPSSQTVNTVLTVTGGITSPPYVYSASNSAGYGRTIAQGSLFVIFGNSMGPSTLVQISALPLPYVLSGTSVSVTSGSTTLNCPMIYTSAGQVAAILPSNTPLGPANLTVAYEGIAQPGYSSTQITVAQNAVGLFTITSTGAGTGIFTALDGTLKTFANSAKPGDILTAWATGLGPIGTPDNVLPASFPNFPNVTVFVGGQAAQIIYAGRSGCCAGVDQISFTVPVVTNGCNVPVTVVSGAVSSNTVALPISDLGGACTDSGPTLPTSFLTKAAAGQPVSVGAIAIGPAVIEGNRILAATQAVADQLSAALHTQVSETDAARLMRAYAGNKPKAVRRVMAAYSRQWKALDVRTKAALASKLAQTQQGVVTEFASYRSEGLVATLASAQLPVAGSCIVVPANTFSSGLGSVAKGLDAGTSLSLTGPAGSFTLKSNVKGQYSALFNSSVTGPDIPSGSYTLTGPGGKDVGAFSATITVASPLAISNKPSLVSVDRAQPLTVTWTGGVAGTYVLIVGTTPATYTSDAYNPKANFVCAEDGGKATFTVPSYILSSSNATASGNGTLLIAPHPLSNQITIPGIDLAYFADGSSDSVNVTFK